MSLHGYDPGDRNNWYQSPHLGLFPVSPAVYGGGISGVYCSTHASHPHGSPSYPAPPFRFPFQPIYPPPPPPSQTIINGYTFPPHFPYPNQTHTSTNQLSYPHSHAMVEPELPSFQPQYAINPSIPTFRSPSVPTFVPQPQFTDPIPPSSICSMGNCEPLALITGRMRTIPSSSSSSSGPQTHEDTTNPSSLPPISDVFVQKEVLRYEAAISALIDKLEKFHQPLSITVAEEVSLAGESATSDYHQGKQDVIVEGQDELMRDEEEDEIAQVDEENRERKQSSEHSQVVHVSGTVMRDRLRSAPAVPSSGNSILGNDKELEDNSDMGAHVSDSELEQESEGKGDVRLTESSQNSTYNKESLLEKLGGTSWPKNAKWVVKLMSDTEQEQTVDVHDDLPRELAFYTQALNGMRMAFEKLQLMGLPFLRPEDYYAEMVKPEFQLEKVKSQFLLEMTTNRSQTSSFQVCTTLNLNFQDVGSAFESILSGMLKLYHNCLNGKVGDKNWPPDEWIEKMNGDADKWFDNRSTRGIKLDNFLVATRLSKGYGFVKYAAVQMGNSAFNILGYNLLFNLDGGLTNLAYWQMSLPLAVGLEKIQRDAVLLLPQVAQLKLPQFFQSIKKLVLLAGALKPVIDSLSSPCLEIQRAAALLLGQLITAYLDCKAHIVQRHAVQPLIKMLQSPDSQVREMSAFAMGGFAQDTHNQDGIVHNGPIHNQDGIAHNGPIVPLFKLLNSKKESLRHNAAFALYKEGNLVALIKFEIVQKFEDGEFFVQRTKDCVEGKICGRVSNNLLYLMWVTDEDVQSRIALALAHLGKPGDRCVIFIEHKGMKLLLGLLQSKSLKQQHDGSLVLHKLATKATPLSLDVITESLTAVAQALCTGLHIIVAYTFYQHCSMVVEASIILWYFSLVHFSLDSVDFRSAMLWVCLIHAHEHALDYLFMTYTVHALSLPVATMFIKVVTGDNLFLFEVAILHLPCQTKPICHPRRFCVDEAIDFLKSNSTLSVLRYSFDPLLSKDNYVGFVAYRLKFFQYVVGHVHQDEFFLATHSSIFYSPFHALVRKFFPLSPIAAIRLIQPLLAIILREHAHYIIGIVVVISINELVSLKSKKQGLEPRYGDVYNGNHCSPVSCSLFPPEFMNAWLIKFCFVTIDLGDLALVPSKHFPIPMWSNEAYLPLLLSAIMHSQIMEFVISSHLLQSPIREALRVFPNKQNLNRRQSNSDSHVSVHLCALIHTWQVTDDENEATTVAIALNSSAAVCIQSVAVCIQLSSRKATFDTDIYVATALIGMYSKCGLSLNFQDKEAVTYFKKMRQHEMLPTPFSYATLLSCCAELASSFQAKQITTSLILMKISLAKVFEIETDGGFAHNLEKMCLLIAGHEWAADVISSYFSLLNVDDLADQFVALVDFLGLKKVLSLGGDLHDEVGTIWKIIQA